MTGAVGIIERKENEKGKEKEKKPVNVVFTKKFRTGTKGSL